MSPPFRADLVLGSCGKEGRFWKLLLRGEEETRQGGRPEHPREGRGTSLSFLLSSMVSVHYFSLFL